MSARGGGARVVGAGERALVTPLTVVAAAAERKPAVAAAPHALAGSRTLAHVNPAVINRIFVRDKVMHARAQRAQRNLGHASVSATAVAPELLHDL